MCLSFFVFTHKETLAFYSRVKDYRCPYGTQVNDALVSVLSFLRAHLPKKIVWNPYVFPDVNTINIDCFMMHDNTFRI